MAGSIMLMIATMIVGVMMVVNICSAFELHGGGSGYVDYKQLEVDPSHKLSIEIGVYFAVRIFLPW